MSDAKEYDFTSERLGFRNWRDSDIDKMLVLNQDSEVMKFFPSIQDHPTTSGFIKRMQTEYAEFGYCYFAVEEKSSQEFLGFIGISNQDYGPEVGKFVDIGWRLKRSAWGKGYATEGAKQCLIHAKDKFNLAEIFSVAPRINDNSIKVMHKIGMKFVQEFTYQKLIDYPKIKQCVLYKINL